MMIFPHIRRAFRNVIHFSQASLVRLLFLALFLLSITSVSSASFSHLINYQGKLTDNSNIAVPDGAYTLTFRLYTTQTGGTPIWTETHSSTTISSGLFSLMLGSITSLDTVNFNQPLYLSVEVNGDGEMSPRKQIGAVPNAMNAVMLDGLATSSFIRSDATNSASTTSTYLTIQQTGTGNIADFIGPSGTALAITSSGVVTIPGTASATQLSAQVATITNLTVTGTTNLTDISSANLSAQSSTIADLSVSSSFNFLGTVITNVATWFNSLFDTRLATKTTSDLAEGSNLYFTYTRASTTAQVVINSTTSLPNITTLTGLTTIGSAGSTTTLPGNLVVGGNASATNLTISQNFNWTGQQGLALFTNGQGGTITGTTGQLLVGVTGSSPAFVTLGGDATINNSGTLTLASVGTPGTYGSASTVPVFTTDSRGRVTAVTNTPITISTTSVTGLGTLATQNANAVNITGGQATFTSLSVSSSFNFLGTVITNVATWFNSLFDTRLATKTTSDLAEGSNLYFTYTRASTTAQAVINSTTSLPNITTLTGLTTIGSAGSTTTLPGNLVVGGNALFNWTSPKTFRAGLGISTPYTAGEVHNDDFILGRYTNSGYMNTGNLLKLVVSGDSDEDYTTILSLNKIWSGDAIYYPPQGAYIKAVDWNGSTIFSLNDNALVYTNFQVNSSGRVLADQGASGAGNLAYSFTSDTDTGIYNKSANTLTIQTGGSDRLTVNSSGYVGIGTSTPANRLDIWGNLWVGTSSLPNLIVDTAKNFIGINKSSPQTALDVFGTASSSNLIVSGTATTTNLVVTGNNFQINSLGRVLANQGASGAGNLAYSFVGNTGTGFYAPASNELRIQTDGSDRLTINSSGYVGINNSSPSALLTVGSGPYFLVNNLGRVQTDMGASGAGNLAYSFIQDTDTGIYNKSANTLTIQTGGSDRLTVNSSGYVGIGTSTPANRLDIWGNLWVGTSSLPNLIVDTAKNFIGINKSSPQTALDVFGTASSSNLIVSGTATTTNLVVNNNMTATGNVLINWTSPKTFRAGLGISALSGNYYSTDNFVLGRYSGNPFADEGSLLKLIVSSNTELGDSTTILSLNKVWSGAQNQYPPGGNYIQAVNWTGSTIFSVNDSLINMQPPLHANGGLATNYLVVGTNYNSPAFTVDGNGGVFARSGTGGNYGLAYSFTSDPNTGIYNPSSDTFTIQTGGVDRLKIDSYGNVGIGTSPSYPYKLTVSGGIYGAFISGYTNIAGNVSITSDLYLPGVEPADYGTGAYNYILLWNDTTNKVGLGASADIAEKINSPDQLEDGEVVVADPNNDESVVRADRAYSSSVLGVVVKKPGAIIGGKGKYSLVLAGRVRIRVSAENGPIRRGDLITTANTPGYGMLASDSNAGVYAVALENFNPSSSSTTGTILAMVRTGASLPQSPLAKLDSLIAGGKINTTDLWQIDQQTGKIKPFTNLDLSDQTLDNVRAISSASGLWSITAEGVIVAEEINTKKLTTDLGITTRDRATGEYYCIFIEAGVMRSTLGRCATTTNTTNSSPMILPPTDSGMTTTTPSSSVPITTDETTVTTTTVATTTDEGAAPSTPPTTEETTTEPASH